MVKSTTLTINALLKILLQLHLRKILQKKQKFLDQRNNSFAKLKRIPKKKSKFQWTLKDEKTGAKISKQLCTKYL